MKTLVWTAPEKMIMQEINIPPVQERDILIKVDAVGICGSEIEGFLGHNSLRNPPLVMGHEFSGYVEKVGTNVSGFSEGDKVIVNPLIGCGKCRSCQNNNENICEDRSIIGIHRNGAFAEYVVVPASNIHKVTPSINSFRAALTEPLACSLRATKRVLQNHPFANVIIFGAGTIGLLCAQVSKILGATNIIILDNNPLRLNTIKSIGFKHAFNPDKENIVEKIESIIGSEGIHAVIDSVGFQATRSFSLELINPGGTMMNIGLGIDETELRMNHIIRNEINILGSFCYSKQDFLEAIELLISGKITEQGWTEVRKLNEGQQAFKDLVSGRVSKAKVFLDPVFQE